MPAGGLGLRHHQVDLDAGAAVSRRTKPPSARATAVPSAGSAAHAERLEHRRVGQARSEQRQHRQIGGLDRDVGPEHHLAQVRQQRLAAPRFGVEHGDAVEFGLQPVIFDTALTVEAQILGDRAVGQLADVLGGEAVQPRLAVGAGQRQHGPVRTVDHDRAVRGGPLLAERVAVMPDGAGVGTGGGSRYPGSARSIGQLYESARAAAGATLIAHGPSTRSCGHARRAAARSAGAAAARRRSGRRARRRHLRDAAGPRRPTVSARSAPARGWRTPRRLVGSARARICRGGAPRWRPRCERWLADGGDEGVLRLVYSRGREVGAPDGNLVRHDRPGAGPGGRGPPRRASRR